VRKVRGWLILGLFREFHSPSSSASSLTLNQKEEVKNHERNLEGAHLKGCRTVVASFHRRLRSVVLCASRRMSQKRANWRMLTLQVPLGIAKALLSVWESLTDTDGFLALPAKTLCVVIMALIVYHPVAIWFAIMGKPPPLCYILYTLFLFYVATILILGAIIGYLREGG